ncbi:hypothetical protein WMY93_027063 [Mugilogobius chulae]|uniref:Uncharacterized protein n=1 Tax=Mugilogobius chulae TaxID=88201 RepID=A0AAW0N0U3_9GOBI
MGIRSVWISYDHSVQSCSDDVNQAHPDTAGINPKNTEDKPCPAEYSQLSKGSSFRLVTRLLGEEYVNILQVTRPSAVCPGLEQEICLCPRVLQCVERELEPEVNVGARQVRERERERERDSERGGERDEERESKREGGREGGREREREGGRRERREREERERETGEREGGRVGVSEREEGDERRERGQREGGRRGKRDRELEPEVNVGAQQVREEREGERERERQRGREMLLIIHS